MPTEELGASAYRKYDIEVWMPSRDDYGEVSILLNLKISQYIDSLPPKVSSASNCTDYQSRRLNMRYQVEKGDNHYTHTLNGTALATPRIILSIIENFQQKDGSVALPEVLHPYMHGHTHLLPKSK